MSTQLHARLGAALCGLFLLAGLAGCYSAEFDPNASEVFACSLDEECSEGSTCESGVCVVDEGPSLEITGPEFLAALGEGATTFDLTIRGSGLELTSPGGDPVDGQGYIELTVDGLSVLSAVEGNEISSGALATGIVIQGIMLPNLDTTVHRVEISAFRADGSPYLNRSAEARQMFFRDVSDDIFTDANGLQPQVGILEPWPGEELDSTQDVRVTVGAINWDGETPVASGADKDAPGASKEGHLHIYFNLDEKNVPDEETYPNCLPTCNLNYATTFNPSSAGTDNEKVLSGVVPLAEEFATKDQLDIRVGLQWNDHTPYPAPSNVEDEWDIDDGNGGTVNVRSLFVNDEVEVDLR